MPSNRYTDGLQIDEDLPQSEVLGEPQQRGPPSFKDEEFFRAKFVRARYQISDPTLFRWIKSGKFPAPEYLNGQRVWRKSALEKAESNLLSAA